MLAIVAELASIVMIAKAVGALPPNERVAQHRALRDGQPYRDIEEDHA